MPSLKHFYRLLVVKEIMDFDCVMLASLLALSTFYSKTFTTVHVHVQGACACY